MCFVNNLTDDDFQRVHDTCPDPPPAMLMAGSFAALLEALTYDSFTVNTEATANWEGTSGEQWTVPINFQMAKVTRLGKRPLSVDIGPGFYVEKPEGGPSWKLRAVLTPLFPT